MRAGGHQERGYQKWDRISTMIRTGGHEARGNAAGTTARSGRVSRYTTTWQVVASRMLAARQPRQHDRARALQLGSPRVSGMKSLPDMVGLLLLVLSDHDHGLAQWQLQTKLNCCTAVWPCFFAFLFLSFFLSCSFSLLGSVFIHLGHQLPCRGRLLWSVVACGFHDTTLFRRGFRAQGGTRDRGEA